MALLFAAAYPERALSVVLVGSGATMMPDEVDRQEQIAIREHFAAVWGTPDSLAVPIFVRITSYNVCYTKLLRTVDIPRAAGGLRIVVARGQRARGGETADTGRTGRHLRTAGHHDVGIAVGNTAGRDADIVGCGRAGGNQRQIGAVDAVGNRDVTGHHVDDASRNNFV